MGSREQKCLIPRGRRCNPWFLPPSQSCPTTPGSSWKQTLALVGLELVPLLQACWNSPSEFQALFSLHLFIPVPIYLWWVQPTKPSGPGCMFPRYVGSKGGRGDCITQACRFAHGGLLWVGSAARRGFSQHMYYYTW